MNINPKSAARLSATQSFYSLLIDSNQNVDSATNASFKILNNENIKLKKKFTEDLVKFCISEKESLNFIIKKYLDREYTIETINPLLLSIVTVAVGELLMDQKTDRPIIVSEYVTIASDFFGPQETGFVNAILDKFIKDNK
jgi:transcription antitermination factor NusB